MNIIIVIVLVLIIVAAIVCFLISKTSNQDSSAENFKYDTSRRHRSSINYNVKSTNFGSESKPNATYNINDVKLPISEASNASLNNKTNTSTIGVVSSIDNEISDLEKQLNSVKIISDQIPELTKLIKLSEKNKTDIITRLNNDKASLESELKDIKSKLVDLNRKLDQQPVLLSLIHIKQICENLKQTSKPLSNKEIIDFILGTINEKLKVHDIHLAEFKVGTRLADLPGEQIDVSSQTVSTENESENNTVAKLISPCYSILVDSKKIILCKAVVSIFKYNPTTPPQNIINN